MSNPTMYDYDGEKYYIDEDSGCVRSYDGSETYDGQTGEVIDNDDY